MRRLLTIIPMTVLAFGALTPARAADGGVACVGTGGYDAAGQWHFQPYAPFEYRLPSSCGPAITPPWTDPPSWLPDPTKPSVLSQVIYYANAWAQRAPAGYPTWVNLVGSGDFACGNGVLTATPGLEPSQTSRINYRKGLTAYQWALDWTATFSNGVGSLSGTATYTSGADPAAATRTISGTIVIDDGAAIGQCDDMGDASNVAINLTLS